jgi:ABC-type multidrug transport system ATPase subunit
MHKNFRGEAIYTAEVDVHFPMLSVRDTLTFAARARVPRNPPGGVSKIEFADHMRDVVMAMFGISHTADTRVGNEYIRGVSGGERKRVTISEATLSRAPLQCWDNSTRGLDSANAIEFCKTLRISTDILRATACVSIYQAPQAAFDCFDKAIVLYEGRQIFFGKTTEARAYFEQLGFYCPDRQTTADFLTSMTSPQERVVRDGFEGRVPRTPDEFAARWKDSQQRTQLLKDIEAYDKKYQLDGTHLEQFKTSRKAQQSRNQYVTRPSRILLTPQARRLSLHLVVHAAGSALPLEIVPAFQGRSERHRNPGVFQRRHGPGYQLSILQPQGRYEQFLPAWRRLVFCDPDERFWQRAGDSYPICTTVNRGKACPICILSPFRGSICQHVNGHGSCYTLPFALLTIAAVQSLQRHRL